jgi:Sortase domain
MPIEKTTKPIRKTKTALRSNENLLAILVGLLFMAYSGYTFAVRYSKTHGKPVLPDVARSITSNTPSPSEKKPNAKETITYEVPADQPRSIRISSVGINGLIQKVGTSSDGAMAVPSNIFFAGWFVGGVKPGQDGLSIINGHVTGNYTDAIFQPLGNVKPKDTIEIEFGDKSVKKFLVLDSVKLPEAKSAEYLFNKRNTVTAQLNLITCDGKFNSITRTFDDRIIVVAGLQL